LYLCKLLMSLVGIMTHLHLHKGQEGHPYAQVSPEGCVAEAARFFVRNGIDIAFTRALFPQRPPSRRELGTVK
jgi:hypothetical protein